MGAAGDRLDIGLHRSKPNAIPADDFSRAIGPFVDFVAIDLETANASRASICSVGVAAVHDGEIKFEGAVLIDPEVEFSRYNIAVNGIDADDVRESPTMPEFWPTLMRVVDGSRLCAHAATFDVGALRSTAARYRLPGPTFDVFCSWRISKRVWPRLASYGLGIVAPAIGFKFDHHDAGQDALACAHVMLAAQRDLGVNSLDELMERIGYSPGHLTPSSFEAADAAPLLNASDGHPGADPNHPLFGKTICFTGAMFSMVRHEAAAAVVEVGANFKNSVGARLDYLVIGDADFVAFADGWKTGKLERVIELQAEGCRIEIVAERDFLALLYS